MLFIVKYEIGQHLLIDSNYMPFKCGIDICFNKSHTRANLNNGNINYIGGTEVVKDYATYQVKHFFKEDIVIGRNVLCISPYSNICDMSDIIV